MSEEKAMKGDIDPRKEFYLALSVDNLDGSCDVEWDGSFANQGESDAIQAATDIVEEHGGEFVIARCIPIKRIYRPKPKVVTLAKAK